MAEAEAAAVDRREDVDAGRLHDVEVVQAHVEAAHPAQPPHHRGVEVRRHHLVAGQRLEPIVARECQRTPRRAVGGRCADVEVDRHPLPRAGPRAAQREVLPRVFLAAPHLFGVRLRVRLPDAERIASTSLSLRYQTYPRLNDTSRDQKKLCGGGNAAIEPPGPSRRRRADCSRAAERGPCSRRRRTGSPASCSTTSRHATRDAGSIAQALEARFVLVGDRVDVGLRDRSPARSGSCPCRSVYCRRPANTPSCTPSKLISSRAPLVFTSQPRAA